MRSNLAFRTFRLFLLFVLSSLLHKEVATGLYAEIASVKFDNEKHFLNLHMSFDLLIHFLTAQWVILFPLKALFE